MASLHPFGPCLCHWALGSTHTVISILKLFPTFFLFFPLAQGAWRRTALCHSRSISPNNSLMDLVSLIDSSLHMTPKQFPGSLLLFKRLNNYGIFVTKELLMAPTFASTSKTLLLQLLRLCLLSAILQSPTASLSILLALCAGFVYQKHTDRYNSNNVSILSIGREIVLLLFLFASYLGGVLCLLMAMSSLGILFFDQVLSIFWVHLCSFLVDLV